jgi:uncharacterized UBP type Zn finger protein
MGFPRVRCEKALHATGNNDAEAAMNWLFAHMEDADIDTSMDLSGGLEAPEAMHQSTRRVLHSLVTWESVHHKPGRR